MKYKMVAIDLDGTLLNDLQKISEKNQRIIKEVSEMGVKVIIATGRMYVSALPYIKTLNLSGPMITYNGALVKDINNGDVLYHKPMENKLAQKIIYEAKKKNLHINLYTDDKLYVDHMSPEVNYYEKISGVKANKVESLLSFTKKDITKLLIVERDNLKHKRFLNFFLNNYSDVLSISKSSDTYIDVMAKGVSKGSSLLKISKKLGIKKEEIIAIGDSYNDLNMLKFAGLGVAMGNSSRFIQDQAQITTLANNNNGVAQVLKDIFY